MCWLFGRVRVGKHADGDFILFLMIWFVQKNGCTKSNDYHLQILNELLYSIQLNYLHLHSHSHPHPHKYEPCCPNGWLYIVIRSVQSVRCVQFCIHFVTEWNWSIRGKANLNGFCWTNFTVETLLMAPFKTATDTQNTIHRPCDKNQSFIGTFHAGNLM